MSRQNVIFGTGPVGRAVMHVLHERGENVRMVNRSGQANLPDGVELLAGDLRDADVARQAAADADVVFYAVNVPYPQWVELLPLLQRNAIAAASAARAKLVVMDNLYMYGYTKGQPMTEDMPQTPHTRKGKLRKALAAELMDAHSTGRVQVAIGRASDFIGGGVDGAIIGGERVIQPMLAGKPARILGNPDMPHTYAYIPDVGKGLVALSDHDTALGDVWHLPASRTVTTRQLLEMIAAQAGVESRIVATPKIILHAMGVFDPVMREVVEMLYQFEEPFYMDSSKFVNAFGDTATPLEQVVAEIAAYYLPETAASPAL